MDKNKLRSLAINLLDDPNGINHTAYLELQNFVFDNAPGSCDDIWKAVSASNGYEFLPENHGLTP